MKTFILAISILLMNNSSLAADSSSKINQKTEQLKNALQSSLTQFEGNYIPNQSIAAMKVLKDHQIQSKATKTKK